MVFGMDGEKGAQLFKVDPAGYFVGCKAAAAGAKEEDASQWLEKKLKKGGGGALDVKATVQLALGCLQSVLAQELHPHEIEVAAVSAARPHFHRLSNEAVEAHLNEMAEHE